MIKDATIAALTDALATARIRLRDEERAITLTTGSDRAFAIRERARYAALITRLESRLAAAVARRDNRTGEIIDGRDQ